MRFRIPLSPLNFHPCAFIQVIFFNVFQMSCTEPENPKQALILELKIFYMENTAGAV